MIRMLLAIIAVLCAIGAISVHRMHNPPNLLLPPGDPRGWKWEQATGASGAFNPDQDGLHIDVTKSDNVLEHLQLYQETAFLKDGHKYRFAFMGRSSASRTITVCATQSYYPGSNGAGIGMDARFTLDNEWKPQEATFTAKGTDSRVDRVPRIFVGAGPPTTIWMKDIRLEQVD